MVTNLKKRPLRRRKQPRSIKSEKLVRRLDFEIVLVFVSH